MVSLGQIWTPRAAGMLRAAAVIYMVDAIRD